MQGPESAKSEQEREPGRSKTADGKPDEKNRPTKEGQDGADAKSQPDNEAQGKESARKPKNQTTQTASPANLTRRNLTHEKRKRIARRQARGRAVPRRPAGGSKSTGRTEERRQKAAKERSKTAGPAATSRSTARQRLGLGPGPAAKPAAGLDRIGAQARPSRAGENGAGPAETGKGPARGGRRRQEAAIRELEQAKAELEEILRQLREEELERMLAMLEARFRKMLQAEIEVYEGTKRVDRRRRRHAIATTRSRPAA